MDARGAFIGDVGDVPYGLEGEVGMGEGDKRQESQGQEGPSRYIGSS